MKSLLIQSEANVEDNNIKEKFLKHGIPYNDIDKQMIEIIDVLNFDLNIKTKFCCFGHNKDQQTYIVFDENVNDNDIISLAVCLNEHLEWFGEFNKWIRSSGKGNELMINWVWESKWYYDPKYDHIKENNLIKIVKILKNHKKQK